MPSLGSSPLTLPIRRARRHNPAGILGGLPVIDDELVVVFESQLGVGWARELGRAELHVRTVAESQFWLNDTFADPFVGIGSNLGLIGAALRMELRY